MVYLTFFDGKKIETKEITKEYFGFLKTEEDEVYGDDTFIHKMKNFIINNLNLKEKILWIGNSTEIYDKLQYLLNRKIEIIKNLRGLDPEFAIFSFSDYKNMDIKDPLFMLEYMIFKKRKFILIELHTEIYKKINDSSYKFNFEY